MLSSASSNSMPIPAQYLLNTCLGPVGSSTPSLLLTATSIEAAGHVTLALLRGVRQCFEKRPSFNAKRADDQSLVLPTWSNPSQFGLQTRLRNRV